MGMWFEHFHFLRPWCLVLLLALCYLLYHLKYTLGSLAAWKKVCDPVLLAYLRVGTAQKSSSLSLWLIGIAGVLSITALAGPVWQQLPQPVYRAQAALIIVLDLSRSMDAADLKPSRLTRAKQKITDLLNLKKEGQTALVVFAGSAFVVTPLTEDKATILLQLQGLSTDMMPVQGGNIDLAMDKSILLLQQASVQHGQVLLFTDSADFSQQKVQQLTAAGHTLNVIAVGTRMGAPIAQAGGFMTDQWGNIVLPKLDVSRLQTLAQWGHGAYHLLTLDNQDIQPMINRAKQDISQHKQQEKMQYSDQWQEEGPWLLWLLIPLALLGFRRGVLVIALCITLQSEPAYALTWQDLWQTPNQQAQVLMQQEDYQQASQHFTNPAWKAAAAYRDHDYQAALQAFSLIQTPSPDDRYNQANALAQLGRLDEAIAQYEQVLATLPHHADALANKTLLEKMKAEQEKTPDKQQGQPQDKKGEKNKSAAEQGQNSTEDPSSTQPTDETASGESSNEPAQAEQDEQDEQTAESATANDDESVAEQVNASPPQDTKQTDDAVSQQQQNADNIDQDTPPQTEQQRAFELQLRRIPDDPAGLLRRKFKYQYQQQNQVGNTSGQW